MLANTLAETALTLVDTRFVANGRDPAIGIDCAGLVLCSLTKMGFTPQDANYILGPHMDLYATVEKCLETMFDRVSPEDPWAIGDVLLIRRPPLYNHIGIWLGNPTGVGYGSMVHANDRDKVRVTPIDHAVQRRVKAIWRIREDQP